MSFTDPPCSNLQVKLDRTPEVDDFLDALHLAGQRLYKCLMRHRDRYIKAWVAATGVYPTEAVLKEYRTETGFETQVVLQRLEDKDETLRVYEQVLLQAGLLPRARAILKERKEIK